MEEEKLDTSQTRFPVMNSSKPTSREVRRKYRGKSNRGKGEEKRRLKK